MFGTHLAITALEDKVRALEDVQRARILAEGNQKFITGGIWDIWTKLREHTAAIEKLQSAGKVSWQEGLQAILLDRVHPPTLQSVIDFLRDRDLLK